MILGWSSDGQIVPNWRRDLSTIAGWPNSAVAHVSNGRLVVAFWGQWFAQNRIVISIDADLEGQWHRLCRQSDEDALMIAAEVILNSETPCQWVCDKIERGEHVVAHIRQEYVGVAE